MNSGSIIITNNVDGHITVAPNGNGKIKVGGSVPTITSDGNTNLKLETDNGTNSGSIVISAGANGPITIAPQGSGTVKVNPTGASTLSANSISTVIEINGGYNNGTPGAYGAQFDISSNNAGQKFTNLSITGKLNVDGDIDPTALILSENSSPNSYPQGKLVLYNNSGTLKFKYNIYL